MAKKNLKTLYDAGVKIAFGTDSQVPLRALVPYARCIEDDDSRRIGPGLSKGSEREP